MKERVKKHINSIPRIESHYLRKQTTKEYIEGGKTIMSIYSDYKEECLKDNVTPVHRKMYADIFHNDFNISFFQPKKDQCDLCEAFKNANDEIKLTLKVKYETHLIEKDLSRKEKDDDKSKANKTLVVACYDLQATFPVPKGEISLFYYKSKLNCINFTITELSTKEVQSYTWHEGEGCRGINEIGTCIWRFLKEKSDMSEGQEIEVIMYSDNCSGQQKNKYMVSLYMYAVSVLNIKSITHKFLIKGHTQNENDTAHSVIEKAIKRTLKSGPIYIPAQYVSVIRSAKKTGQPYKVNEMCHSDFYDWKKHYVDCKFVATEVKSKEEKEQEKLAKISTKGVFKAKKLKQTLKKKKQPNKLEPKIQIFDDEESDGIEEQGKLAKNSTKRGLKAKKLKKTANNKTQPKKLNPKSQISDDEESEGIEEGETSRYMLSKVLVLRVEKKDPKKILYKNSYSDQVFKEHQLYQQTPFQALNEMQIQKAFKKKLEINTRKKSDLMSMVNSGVVPQFYKEFYENL